MDGARREGDGDQQGRKYINKCCPCIMYTLTVMNILDLFRRRISYWVMNIRKRYTLHGVTMTQIIFAMKTFDNEVLNLI